MYCRRCGTKLKENAKFCTNCGTNTEGEIQEVKENIKKIPKVIQSRKR